MWNGKRKALTFSYDDGVQADKRLIAIFDRYGMKGTFNISSALLHGGTGWHEHQRGLFVEYIDRSEVPTVYASHEVAIHAAHHPDLTALDVSALPDEIAGDRAALEALLGREVIGMAYPYGTYNDAVLKAVEAAGIRYARTIEDGDFSLPRAPLTWAHTCHHNNARLFDLAEDFLASTPDTPQVFAVWGHSYEFDVDENWERIERFCQLMAHRDDIAYVTNREVLGL